jgi:hypothetical protein
MTTDSSLLKMKLTPRIVMDEMESERWTWRSAGANFGLGSGIISSIAGSALTAIAWFTGPKWYGFSIQFDGTVLLFLTIPSLIFGAHCLDLMSKLDKEARERRSNLSRANGTRKSGQQ